MQNWKRIAPDNPPARTRYQETPRYAEGLYDLKQDIYAWMVPNGSWGESNAGLIVGDGESLLVDTLWDVPYTRTMLDAMRPLLDAAPLKTVVNTHADGDHFWGNQLVTDAYIITSERSYDEMLHIKPSSTILLGRVGSLLQTMSFLPGAANVGHWFQQLSAPYDFAGVTPTLPNETFTGEKVLNVGGREVRLIEVGPAHTQGDLMVHVPDARLLFSADILFIGSTPVMWAGPVENWFKALDLILDLDVDAIVPGHGPITDKDGVRQVRAYWEFVTQALRTHFIAGHSAEEAATAVALSSEFASQPFAQWNSPERLMTNAHTQYRHWQGRKDAPKVPEIMNTLRKQALLAHKLPDAQPQVMRRK